MLRIGDSRARPLQEAAVSMRAMPHHDNRSKRCAIGIDRLAATDCDSRARHSKHHQFGQAKMREPFWAWPAMRPGHRRQKLMRKARGWMAVVLARCPAF